MKPPFAAIILSIAAITSAHAVEYNAYKATISIPFVSSTFENDTDKFVTTKMSNKQLINVALGQPLKSKVPKGVVLAVLVPAASGGPFPVSLVVMNQKTGAVLRSVATMGGSNFLVPTDLKKPAAALFSLNFLPLSSAAFATDPFSLAGAGTGTARLKNSVISIVVDVAGLHGSFTRTDPGAAFFYAGVITRAVLRASGKPIATLNL